MKKVAIVTSDGIGDALLMMIAAHKFHQSRYDVTLFHPKIHELANWFPEYRFDCVKESLDNFQSYDLVIVQHPSKNVDRFCEYRKNGHLPNMMLFYPHYHFDFGPFNPKDYQFDNQKLLTQNIAEASCHILPNIPYSLDNGLRIPKNLHLTHRKHLKRVLIHPASADDKKNWTGKKFCKVAKALQKQGYEVSFILHSSEKQLFESQLPSGIKCPDFSNLSDLASYVYESGYLIGNDSLLGHLASLLNLPTIIIASCKRHIKMWRPGWRLGEVVLPVSWAPNIKFFRIREKYWQHFISPSAVLEKFSYLVKNDTP